MERAERECLIKAIDALHACVTSHEFDFPTETGDDRESWTDWHWMTLCLILAKSSASTHGHMAAIAVDSSPITKTIPPSEVLDNVILWANNTPLLPFDSTDKSGPEIHAEQCVIAKAAARGRLLAGATLYVIFPPCAVCLAAILHSGLKRCVHRRQLQLPYAQQAAVSHHVSFTSLPGSTFDTFRAKIAKSVWQALGQIPSETSH